MDLGSHHITDLDLQRNSIGNEGARLLARSFESNALPNLTYLSLSNWDIEDDGLIALVSALEQKPSLHVGYRNSRLKEAFLPCCV
jgi:hypothetical protein